MEILIEILYEVFLEGYVGLMVGVLPKNKLGSTAYKVAKITITIVSVVCFVAIVFGFIAMFSKDNLIKNIGTYAFFVSLTITIIQITVGVICRIKK